MDRAKRILVQSWLRKAQRDLIAAQKLAVDLPDIAIYHCQQSAEKALKSFLILHDSNSGDTHNIGSLVKQASAFKSELALTLKDAGYLSQYNQTYRYPREATDDFNPTPGELNKALRVAKEVYRNIIVAMPSEVVSHRQQQQRTEQGPSHDEELEL